MIADSGAIVLKVPEYWKLVDVELTVVHSGRRLNEITINGKKATKRIENSFKSFKSIGKGKLRKW